MIAIVTVVLPAGAGGLAAAETPQATTIFVSPDGKGGESRHERAAAGHVGNRAGCGTAERDRTETDRRAAGRVLPGPDVRVGRPG